VDNLKLIRHRQGVIAFSMAGTRGQDAYRGEDKFLGTRCAAHADGSSIPTALHVVDGRRQRASPRCPI